MSKLKNNNKGLSIVEFIVVLALVSIIVTISAGPLVNIYKARAKSAAYQISAMISQCKINALSSISNELTLSFDEDENEFVCSLYSIDKDGNVADESYKDESIGNNRLDILIENHDLKKGTLHIRFNNQTGSVEMVKFNDTDLSSNYINTLHISSNNEYKIELYKSTGNQEPVFVK